MKGFITTPIIVLGALLGLTFLIASANRSSEPALGAAPVFTVPQGGTGSSTLSGILKGNGTSKVGTVVIGSNLTWDGTTLSASGGSSSFSYPFPNNATSTAITFNGGLTGTLTGNADTATALAADGSNCSAGSFPLGVSAAGAVQNCTDAWTEAENTSAAYISDGNTLWDNSYGFVTSSFSTTSANWWASLGLGHSTTSFNNSFNVALAATTSIKSITTLPSLSLPYSQLSGTPVIASSSLLGDTNTWSGNNKFTNSITVSSLSGLVGANSGLLYSFASSSLFGYTPLNPTRQLTISGTANQITSSAGAQDLSADRTWTLSLPNHVIFPSSFKVGSASSTNATSTNLDITGLLTFNGVTASTWAAFCTTITGSAGLCDGVDNTAAGAANPFTWEENFAAINAATTSILWAKNGLNASSTSNLVNLFVTNASSTNLAALSQSAGCANFLTGGALVSTGIACGSGGGIFSFTPVSYGNATSTTLGLLNGLTASASSTITELHLPLSNGGLGVNGSLVYSGATTTAGTGITYSGNAFNVNTSQNISTLSNLTSNGFVKTSGGDGTLSIDTNTYLTTVDISANTNLAATWPIILTNDTLSFGGLSTSSNPTVGQLPYWTGVNTFGSVATGTVSSGTGISLDNSTRSVIGGSLQITNTGVISASCSGMVSCSGTNPLTIASPSWPWTTTTNAGTTTSATTTPPWFKMGLFASSTSVFTNASTTAFSVGSDYLTDITGSGLAISGNALNVSLQTLTATNGTLTFSGSYDGLTARTVGLNLGNANTWTALQNFSNATSTQLSALQAWFGTTATSTFTSAGWLGVATTSPFKALSVTGEIWATATTTTAGLNVLSPSVGTSTIYIYSKTTGFGGNIIMEDTGGGACTQITTKAGVVSGAVVTCPTEL